MNIAVFASHGGSDLQAIIDGCKKEQINATVVVVISNNKDSVALQRAKNEHIPNFHMSSKKYGSEEILAEEILKVLAEYNVDMIFLAGYMRLLHVSILETYDNRIFNIHPALLPKFGGKGMFGMNVHNAVIKAKEKETGVTIHRVNAEYDSGEIVAQTKVAVMEDDTPEILAARVLHREHEFLIETISNIVEGKIQLGSMDSGLKGVAEGSCKGRLCIHSCPCSESKLLEG
ncbi:MAG: phosphoribosylglycinamide formyltransferase [Clostridiaceae bacterium]|nr:phosphoribosylglycinamide formyltransferase [Clostridiaceae bacterium]